MALQKQLIRSNDNRTSSRRPIKVLANTFGRRTISVDFFCFEAERCTFNPRILFWRISHLLWFWCLSRPKLRLVWESKIRLRFSSRTSSRFLKAQDFWSLVWNSAVKNLRISTETSFFNRISSESVSLSVCQWFCSRWQFDWPSKILPSFDCSFSV